jgi:hypothetical protein
VKRRSTNFTSLSLICFMMSFAVVICFLSYDVEGLSLSEG